MKFQFKVQQYQTDAVDAVVDAFAGQPKHDGVTYRIDPGRRSTPAQPALEFVQTSDSGLRNAEIALTPVQLLENICSVQRSRNLPLSPRLVDSKAAAGAPNLDIEMETLRHGSILFWTRMQQLSLPPFVMIGSHVALLIVAISGAVLITMIVVA